MHLKGNIDVEYLDDNKFSIITTVNLMKDDDLSILYENSMVCTYQEFNIVYNRAINRLNTELGHLNQSIALIASHNDENKVLSKGMGVDSEGRFMHILSKKYERVVEVGR